MAKFILVVKYTFLVAVVLSAGVLVQHITGINRWSLPDALVAQDVIYNTSIPLPFENVSSILNKNYLKCLKKPSKPFCLLSADKRMELLKIESSKSPNIEIIESKLKNISSDLQNEGRRMHNLLVDFTTLMAAAGVRAILIEPSMLFCLMSSSKRYNLLKKEFNPGRLQGSRNVATFGIFEEESRKLQEANVTSSVLSAGFKIMKIRKWAKSWSWIINGSEENFETVHFFFIRQEMAVHVVVFYVRNSYLWHSGLDPEEIDIEGLLFVHEAVFENFTGYPLKLGSSPMKQIFIPHNVRYFFSEILISRFKDYRSPTASSDLALKHPFLSMEQLKTRTIIALKEIKTVLAPQLVMFWIWSSSLLGWLKQRDVLHLSTMLELSVSYKSVKGLNITELFAGNEFLKLESSTTLDSDFEYRLDCHGLRINMYIMHRNRNTVWYKHSDGQNVFKLMYPEFPLCSTDVYGQKVNVPCNGDIISSEHRQNWTDDANHSGSNIKIS